MPSRRISFQGAVNFRDIGGYPAAPGRAMRWGRLFRADNLGELTEADTQRLAGLGLHTIIDFRADHERALHVSRLPQGNAMQTLHVGFMDDAMVRLLDSLAHEAYDADYIGEAMIAQYRRFVTDHTLEYGTMLRCLTDARRLPALLHCTSGKDRTGFAIALVLMAVGASRRTIVEDYLLTNDYRRNIGHLFGPATTPAVVESLTSAREAYIDAAFGQIDAMYGSVQRYLEKGLGLSETDRRSLSENLTEPLPSP